MRRLHLFEFEDLRWFPGLLRDYMTDYLRYVSETFDLFGAAVPVLGDFLHRTGRSQIVDLGSGGGGAWRALLPELRREHPGLRLTLTDRYPNHAALRETADACPEVVEVAPDPVDARAVPEHLSGVRTLFLCLHHFAPREVRAIFRNAIEDGAPIVVFEAQRRDIKHVAQFSLSPAGVLLLTPLIRPFRLSRLALTYLLPLVPILVGWDGVVSVLRTYTAEEMLSLAWAADEEERFEWEADVLTSGQVEIPYLLGRPRAGSDAPAS